MRHGADGIPSLSHIQTHNKRPGSPLVEEGLSLKKMRADDLAATGWIFQADTCKSSGFDPKILCSVCFKNGMGDDECRFRKFRWYKPQDNGSASFFFRGSPARSEDHHTYQYHNWKPNQTESQKLLIKV
jgi:hypothetical protein